MAPELTIAENIESPGGGADGSSRPHWLARTRIVAAIVFLLALFIPLIGTFFHWDPVPSTENRQMARAPETPHKFKDYTHFSEVFLAYFRDHFGFRNTMIRGLSVAKFHGGMAFDQGTNIILGKDGWLFYPKKPGSFLADRNLDPFTDADLDVWQRLLERRLAFCADHGIKMIVVIPPDKQSIYPEMLPEDFTRIGKQTRLDQLLDRLRRTHSPVQPIDLRATLLDAKKYHRIYFKTDTHWDDYGAYAAYPVILDAVNKALPWAHLAPQPISDFTPTSSVRSGDLAFFINLHYEYHEDWPQLIHTPPFPQIRDPNNPFAPVITTGSNPHAPSMYMIHDSYTLYLAQFLGPHFSRVCWEWTYRMNDARVLNFKPDQLMDEFLERTLYSPIPVDNSTGPVDAQENLAEPAH